MIFPDWPWFDLFLSQVRRKSTSFCVAMERWLMRFLISSTQFGKKFGRNPPEQILDRIRKPAKSSFLVDYMSFLFRLRKSILRCSSTKRSLFGKRAFRFAIPFRLSSSFFYIVFVTASIAGITSRVNAGSISQGFHFQTRVFGKTNRIRIYFLWIVLW